MFNRLAKLKLTSQQEELLRDTTIDEDGPGTILRDFEMFLSYIGERKLQITKNYNLRLRDVRELNARLTNPLELGLTRPQQKSYPHIHGLYLLVRTSGLTYVEIVRKKPILRLNESVYQLWQSLNPTERYGTLLQTSLIRANSEIIGERAGPFSSSGNLYAWITLFRSLSEQGGDQKNIDDTIRYHTGDYNLGIFESLGFVKAQFGPPKPKKGWYLNRLERTPFGDALLALLMSKFAERLQAYWYALDQDDDNEVLELLQSILQPYFPEWQNNLVIPESEGIFQEGTHIFKVSLGKIWRRIAIPAENDLDTFAYAILQAVDFDNDHLYCFTYRNREGMQIRINHPYMEEEYLTNEIEIGDMVLHAGQTMTFLFDFGDKWEFKITLEHVDNTMEIDSPKLLEAHGEAPRQYHYWDEDEEEWDEEDEEDEEE
ncbi:MAG: IS1096 element passenger TnpR family protein [Ardenticatenaceae bacterium]